MASRPLIAFCQEYPLHWRGGVSVLVETLIHGLAERYDLLLVSRDETKDLPPQVGSRIKEHLSIPREQSPRQTAAWLAQALAERRAALAHLHFGGNYGWGNRLPGQCPTSHLAARGVPVVTTVHSVVGLLHGYCGPQKPLWFKLALLPLAWCGKMKALAGVRREIAVSRHDYEKLCAWYRPFQRKFVQIYHSRLAPQDAPPLERQPVILNVGHVAQRKGQAVLAEAFARIAPKHPGWKLLFVGDLIQPEEADAVRKTAAAHALGDRVQLPGRRDDVLELMRQCGIYAQPSREEALGLALQEAMSAGCPCVGTTVGGIPELITDNQSGLLVPPGDPAALATALERLLHDTPLRQRLGEQARHAIIQKGMTADAMLARHVDLYESLRAQR
ncbi:MAG: glycosyltransferase family 4 protein [Verrucomicrobiota bacterium]